MIERLHKFIKSQGLSTRAFELSISASDGMIRRAISNKTDIQSKWLCAIADKYHDLNIDWLLTGKGYMLKSDIKDEAPPPTPTDDKSSIYYNMYKEQQSEIRSLIEGIGVLKERLRQYQSQIETFQDLPSIRSDSANNTGNQKKYISKKDVTAPNATKELVKNASKHDSKISAATSVAVNSTKQQSGTKKKV